jgi:hypothetical protein
VDWAQIPEDGAESREPWNTVMRLGPSNAIKGEELFDQLGCSKLNEISRSKEVGTISVDSCEKCISRFLNFGKVFIALDPCLKSYFIN